MDMEIVPVMIFFRIDTNTGECRRGVNAAKQMSAKHMGRSYVDSTPQNLNEEFVAAGFCSDAAGRGARRESRSQRSHNAS
jgi:hypothetical protein